MANFNFNQIIIGGRLTADPELKTTPSGVSVTTFTVAVNRARAKEGSQAADFFTVQAWRGTAEFITRYFRKASSICIVGTLQNRMWEKDGQKHYSTEIVAETAYFVDSRDESVISANPAAQVNVSDTNSAYIPEAYMNSAPKFEEISDDEGLPF